MQTQGRKQKDNTRIKFAERISQDPWVQTLANYLIERIGGEVMIMTGSPTSPSINISLREIKSDDLDENMLEQIVKEVCEKAGMTPVKDEPLTFVYQGIKRYFTHSLYPRRKEMELKGRNY